MVKSQQSEGPDQDSPFSTRGASPWAVGHASGDSARGQDSPELLCRGSALREGLEVAGGAAGRPFLGPPVREAWLRQRQALDPFPAAHPITASDCSVGSSTCVSESDPFLLLGQTVPESMYQVVRT